MPRPTKAAKEAQAAAQAVAAPVAPAPMPPMPMGALPGGPVPMSFPPLPQGIGVVPAGPFPGLPVAPAAPPMAPPPTFTLPAGIPTAPTPVAAVAPQTELGVASNALPQIFKSLADLLEKVVGQHAEILGVLGQHNQAVMAANMEVKQHLSSVLDNLGGMGQFLQKHLGIAAPAPAAAPQVQAPVQPQFQPQAAPAPLPVQPVAAAQQPVRNAVSGHPALAHNPCFTTPEIVDYLEKQLSICNGHPYTTFIQAINSVEVFQTAFGPQSQDLITWLQARGCLDPTGTIRV